MAKTTLMGCRVAILATDGFEQDELFLPKEALEDAGAHVEVISLKKGEIKAWSKDNWGKNLKVDAIVSEVDPKNFDALMIPGGVMSPDKLRTDADAVNFVKSFGENGKPIAAICHGPSMLIEAAIVEGRSLTSYPSIRTDLLNAGAAWTDEDVVVDRGLVTSRRPADIPAFNAKMIEEFAEGPHDLHHKPMVKEDSASLHH